MFSPLPALRMEVRKARGDLMLCADFAVEAGGITVLRGASGAGKTTIADMIAGRISPDEGRIELSGRVLFDDRSGINLPPQSRGLGYVFQSHRLMPHLTVEENILFPQRFGSRTPRLKTTDLIELLGIGALLKRKPATLSGGESQRVALARALSAAESMLIMDEPLASLDPERRETLMDYIERIPAVLPMPILYITHSDQETERLAQRILLIEDGRVRTSAAPKSNSF